MKDKFIISFFEFLYKSIFEISEYKIFVDNFFYSLFYPCTFQFLS